MSIGFWVLHRLYVGRRNISGNEASEANHGLMEGGAQFLPPADLEAGLV